MSWDRRDGDALANAAGALERIEDLLTQMVALLTPAPAEPPAETGEAPAAPAPRPQAIGVGTRVRVRFPGLAWNHGEVVRMYPENRTVHVQLSSYPMPLAFDDREVEVLP